MLTFGRLVLTVIFLAMILYSPQVEGSGFLDMAFALFIVAALTDIADGKIARRYNITSKFGRMVDPLADKVLICGGFFCFAWIGEPKLFDFSPKLLAIIQWGTFGIIAAREIFVTVLRHWAEAKGINFAATASGKLKMFVQSFAIGTLTVRMAHVHPAAWGYWLTAVTLTLAVAITVISGVLSVRRTSR